MDADLVERKVLRQVVNEAWTDGVARDNQFTLIVLYDVVVAQRVARLLNPHDWFHGFKALARDSKRVCRTHELAADRKPVAACHPAVAVLTIVLSVLANHWRLSVVVTVLLHTLDVIPHPRIKRSLSHFLLQLVIACEEEDL